MSSSEPTVLAEPLSDAVDGTRTVFFHTFGCQMNAYDTGKMRARLVAEGYSTTDDPAKASVILLNTCSIREKAVDKMDSAIGRYRALKRGGQDLVLGITGCVAQQEGQSLLDKYKDVDLVMGPDAVGVVDQLVAKAKDGARVLDTTFHELDNYAFVSELDPEDQGVGAFVTIQKGCDNKCTFCIVPATRGVEVSRPSEQIVQEVRGLVARGIQEITLIGQNVNSYGLKRTGEVTFAELLYKVAAVPGVERIRYTTSHPRDMGPDVVQAYRDLPQLTSHLHLPVQSGSNRVLRRMKRFYTRERYLGLVDDLRSARPDLALTTDIIAGFPGETDEDFEQTMQLLEEVGFVGSFSFVYSERPDTPALRLLKDAVEPAVASARLSRYQARQRELSAAWCRSHEGKVMEVLVQGPSRHDKGVMCGRTSSHLMINFPGDDGMVGQRLAVRVTRGFTHSARGELIHGV